MINNYIVTLLVVVMTVGLHGSESGSNDALLRLVDKVIAEKNVNLQQQCMVKSVISGQLNCVEKLLKAGVNPNMCDQDGNSLLMLAAIHNQGLVISKLMSCPDFALDLSMRNKQGKTLQEVVAQELYDAITTNRDVIRNFEQQQKTYSSHQECLDDYLKMVQSVYEGRAATSEEQKDEAAIMGRVRVRVKKSMEEVTSPLKSALISHNLDQFSRVVQDMITTERELQSVRALCVQEQCNYTNYEHLTDVNDVLRTAMEQQDIAMLLLLHRGNYVSFEQVSTIGLSYLRSLVQGDALKKGSAVVFLRTMDEEQCARYVVAAAEKNCVPLIKAVAVSREKVDWNRGIVVDFRVKTPLRAAIAKGHSAVAEHLLQQCNVDPNIIDGSGNNALHCALDHMQDGDTEHRQKLEAMIKLLLQHKASKNASDTQGCLPYCKARHESIKKLLLPDNINAQDENGDTALIKAARAGKMDTVQQLLTIAGIDVLKTNNNGQDAECVAQTPEIRDLVRGTGLRNLLATSTTQKSSSNSSLETKSKPKSKQKPTNVLPAFSSEQLLMAPTLNDVLLVQLCSPKHVIRLKQKEKNYWLLKAISRKSIPAIKVLLAHGADINTQDEQGISALILAKKSGIDLVRLSRGTDTQSASMPGGATTTRHAQKKADHAMSQLSGTTKPPAQANKSGNKKKNKKKQQKKKDVSESDTSAASAAKPTLPTQATKPQKSDKPISEKSEREKTDFEKRMEQFRKKMELEESRKQSARELPQVLEGEDGEEYDDELCSLSAPISIGSNATPHIDLGNHANNASKTLEAQLMGAAVDLEQENGDEGDGNLSAEGDYEGDADDQADDYTSESGASDASGSSSSMSLSSSATHTPQTQASPVVAARAEPTQPTLMSAISPAAALSMLSSIQVEPQIQNVLLAQEPQRTLEIPALLSMIQAARKGNLELVKTFIQNGVSVNSKTKMGSTVLMEAIFAGQEDIVNFLLGQKANPTIKNSFGQTALYAALAEGNRAYVTLAAQYPDAAEEALKLSTQTKRSDRDRWLDRNARLSEQNAQLSKQLAQQQAGAGGNQ